MAQVTVVRQDNMVYVNGSARSVDCSHLAPFIHAIQWNDEAGQGEIEFATFNGRKEPNLKFNDFTPYAYLRDNWEEADVAAHMAQVAAEQAGV